MYFTHMYICSMDSNKQAWNHEFEGVQDKNCMKSPCIGGTENQSYITQQYVQLSYNKNQRDALFLTFIFDKEFYMFRTDLLSIIRSLNTVYTAIGICHASYVDRYLLLCIRC